MGSEKRRNDTPQLYHLLRRKRSRFSPDGTGRKKALTALSFFLVPATRRKIGELGNEGCIGRGGGKKGGKRRETPLLTPFLVCGKKKKYLALENGGRGKEKGRWLS